MTSPPPDVLLLSCYELGHQPLGLATPLGFFRRAGIPARALDLSVEPLDEGAVRRADFVLVSVPMHTALRIGLELVPRIRSLNPGCHLVFFGLYATLNADLLLASGVDRVLSGESEEALVDLVSGRRSGIDRRPAPVLERLSFPAPTREGLPAFERYARLEDVDGSLRLVAAVETTRGCRHLCRHCPIPPIYGGRFFVVPKETVLADVSQLVASGAEHIDFVDPDFLNGPGHALAVARALHAEFPGLTFDFTAKIEHLVRHARHLPELRELGCLFVVSAVESLSDDVLRELDKGHRQEDVFRALEHLRAAGIALRPTFLPFTPFSTRTDYLELFRWIGGEGLVSHVDPIQLTLRLLIPPGSLLLDSPRLKPHLLGLDREALTYRWRHPDPEMDRLQQRAAALVEEGVRDDRPSPEIFHALFELARDGRQELPRLPREAPAPRLTEAWFC